jgi:hypothetical protein
VRACVYRGEYSCVYKYLCLYYVFKKIDTRVMYQGTLISYTNVEYAEDGFIRRSYIYDWNMHNL